MPWCSSNTPNENAMSRFHAQDIAAPDAETLTVHKLAVTFNPTAMTVGGLDKLINTQKGAIVCANNGAKDFWYRCCSIEAAAEVLKQHYSGEFLTLKWFGEKS